MSVKLSRGMRASEWSSLISCCSSASSSVMTSSRTTSTCAPSSPGVTWPPIPICPAHVPPATSPLTNQSAKTRIQEAVLKSRQVPVIFSQSVIELVAFNLTLILFFFKYNFRILVCQSRWRWITTRALTLMRLWRVFLYTCLFCNNDEPIIKCIIV